MRDQDRAFLLGLLGVVIFAITVPMTRLATDRPGFPGLDPIFITAGRAAFAGVLSVGYLALTRAPRPDRSQVFRLLQAGLGIVIGFPLFLGLAVRHVDAVHASVITGALPLATAVLAALMLRERASRAFWGAAILGFALVLAYAWLAGDGGKGLSLADLALLAGVGSAAFGYIKGAEVSRSLGPERVICWVLVLYLPLTVPVTYLARPTDFVEPAAWLGFAYVTLFSMWLGFFAWYRGLSADPLRVSQVQLVQPFLSMLFAIPILGERMTAMASLFCLAIIATVALSRKLR
ncbi:MAG: DMT family transporter [Beijerinckiaceae bacterium]|jgi:drug/metabolite transporter (DMT)-like permease|nr:DMT family transporter [Beijerinckiaceae bacterium]